MKYRIRFKVTGRGQFPLDMLRYDACYPVDNDAVMALDYDSHYPQDYHATRSATLGTYSARKNFAPTVDRWSSFGWAVSDISVEKI